MKPNSEKIKPVLRFSRGRWWADCGLDAATGFLGTFQEACDIARHMWESQ